jgi:hypothetical protein
LSLRGRSCRQGYRDSEIIQVLNDTGRCKQRIERIEAGRWRRKRLQQSIKAASQLRPTYANAAF